MLGEGLKKRTSATKEADTEEQLEGLYYNSHSNYVIHTLLSRKFEKKKKKQKHWKGRQLKVNY